MGLVAFVPLTASCSLLLSEGSVSAHYRFEMASSSSTSISSKAVMTVAAMAALVSAASAQALAPAPPLSNDGHLAGPSMLVGLACAACAFVYGRFL